MNDFIFNTAASIVVREGASLELADLIGRRFGKHLLLVTDPGLRAAGLVDPVVAALIKAGHDVCVFDAVEADPSRATLERAVEIGKAHGVTGVVGLGGGSSLDIAKLTALLLGSGEDLDAAWGVNNATGPRLPLVLVPTTAGTGSEVTPVSIITVGDGEKRGVSSPLIVPDIAVLDVGLTMSLPRHITAYTGVDAIVHAIEAYSSVNANNNSLSRMMACQALSLLCGHIESAVADGSNRAARHAMLLGAMLAGQAFGNSPVGAVHALAYPIGGLYHVPHGLSNALVLVEVMRFNLPMAEEAYAEIAPFAFPDLVHLPPHQRAGLLIEKLQALTSTLGLPAGLSSVGIPAEAIPNLAEQAMLQQRLLANNPRPVTKVDAERIYRASYG
ncbi:iron-containing alcohol dehydrogenase [Rhizobium sp. AQ_MP]|uniref:iron-containing alcohol dehydrogenase n=1 Tax=Rhizobium sp. AQ_MP TaxID=2761536 RepID=UPI00163A6BBB|nr:iron-containing alcohol dehydrogenase [Rhizobium sp. AQ_MP]MBC2774578.1 iron-containing alcohol dehydrogenase [Rhizobium sp. AQ_MP]